MTPRVNLLGGWALQAGLSSSGDGRAWSWWGAGREPRASAGAGKESFASSWAAELLLHPAPGKTGTSQRDADETGPNTAGDGPGSCRQSGAHRGAAAPLEGGCQANEMLQPRGHGAQSPKPGPSQPVEPGMGLRPSTPPPRNDDMASEAVSLAVIGGKQLQLIWQTESPAAGVGVVRTAEVLGAPASHSEERGQILTQMGKLVPGQVRFLSSLWGCEEGHHLPSGRGRGGLNHLLVETPSSAGPPRWPLAPSRPLHSRNRIQDRVCQGPGVARGGQGGWPEARVGGRGSGRS